MGYFNYEIAKEQFKNNEFVLETIKRLQDFDKFHKRRREFLLNIIVLRQNA